MDSNDVCIYTKKKHLDADTTSGDHIFLAAIGGMKKLSESYVSHEANNFFSKLEKYFSRDSLISIIRQFEGPGKRGNLNPIRASKSNISVITSYKSEDINQKYSLGYMKLSKPYVISHFVFSFQDETIGISYNPDSIKVEGSHEELLNAFIERSKNLQEYTLLEDEKLPTNLALLGESDSRWFLGINNKELEPQAQKFIDAIKNWESVNYKSKQEINEPVTVHQSYTIDLEDNNRIVAKMAFNFLAFEKGQQFVLDSRFDNIRSWIYTGNSQNTYVRLMQRDKDLEGSLIPSCFDKAHYIIIAQRDSNLIARVSFYGESFSYEVNLGVLLPEDIAINHPIGFICDWKNRKEYSLSEITS